MPYALHVLLRLPKVHVDPNIMQAFRINTSPKAALMPGPNVLITPQHAVY